MAVIVISCLYINRGVVRLYVYVFKTCLQADKFYFHYYLMFLQVPCTVIVSPNSFLMVAWNGQNKKILKFALMFFIEIFNLDTNVIAVGVAVKSGSLTINKAYLSAFQLEPFESNIIF